MIFCVLVRSRRKPILKIEDLVVRELKATPGTGKACFWVTALRQTSSAAMPLVETLTHLLTGLKEGNRLFVHRNMRSGARIAADSSIAVFD